MKYIILAVFSLIFIFSCKKNSGIVNGYPLEQRLYLINSFTSLQGAVDINNDGNTNTNMLLETINIGGNYDFRVDIRREAVYYSFGFPKQNITDSYGSVWFSGYGYSLTKESDFDLIEEEILDDETKIISFEKTSGTEYKLILEKKYYDFHMDQYFNGIFKILYEEIAQ
jgi:hypothetical protein